MSSASSSLLATHLSQKKIVCAIKLTEDCWKSIQEARGKPLSITFTSDKHQNQLNVAGTSYQFSRLVESGSVDCYRRDISKGNYEYVGPVAEKFHVRKDLDKSRSQIRSKLEAAEKDRFSKQTILLTPKEISEGSRGIKKTSSQFSTSTQVIKTKKDEVVEPITRSKSPSSTYNSSDINRCVQLLAIKSLRLDQLSSYVKIPKEDLRIILATKCDILEDMVQLKPETYKSIQIHEWKLYSAKEREEVTRNSLIAFDTMKLPKNHPARIKLNLPRERSRSPKSRNSANSNIGKEAKKTITKAKSSRSKKNEAHEELKPKRIEKGGSNDAAGMMGGNEEARSRGSSVGSSGGSRKSTKDPSEIRERVKKSNRAPSSKLGNPSEAVSSKHPPSVTINSSGATSSKEDHNFESSKTVPISNGEGTPQSNKRKRTPDPDMTTDTDEDTTDILMPSIKSKEEYLLVERQFHKKYKDYMQIAKQIETKSAKGHFLGLKDQLIKAKGTEDESHIRDKILQDYKRFKGDTRDGYIKQWKKLHSELKILKSSLWAAFKPIYGDVELSST